MTPVVIWLFRQGKFNGMIQRGTRHTNEQIKYTLYDKTFFCAKLQSAIGRPGVIATPLIASPEGVNVRFPWKREFENKFSNKKIPSYMAIYNSSAKLNPECKHMHSSY